MCIGGHPPHEKDIIVTHIVRIPAKEFIAIAVLCAIGFVYGCVCLCFNILKRTERYVEKLYYMMRK